MLGDGGLQCGGVDLKGAGQGGDELHGAARPLDEYLVLREIGGDDDVLVPGAGKAVEHTAQRRRRAHGDVQVVAGHTRAEPAVQVSGQQAPGPGVPLGAGVAVEDGGVLRFQQADGGFVHLRGRGDGGVADGKVKDVFPAHLRGPLIAVFKQLPDHRAGGAELLHALRYHGKTSCGNGFMWAV